MEQIYNSNRQLKQAPSLQRLGQILRHGVQGDDR